MNDEQPVWTPPRNGQELPRGESRVIVGAGIGRHYRQRLRSTVNHCEVYCPEAWKLWYDTLPDGCPPHEQSQYAFKICAIQRCIDAGFRYILWMDSSFAAVDSIEPLWKLIEEHGWFVPRQGDAQLGTWTSDIALNIYGITRDEAMDIPLVYSGLVGLDMKNPTAVAIWNLWVFMFSKGAFNGPHYNEDQMNNSIRGWEPVGSKWKGWCSDDPRCLGHRHDESALAFALNRLGLKPMVSGLLTIEDPKGIIGHMIPDYDVVKLREKLLLAALCCPHIGQEEMIQLCR